MTGLAIDAKPIRLEDLLDTVDDGTAVLPAFQRDFDWSVSDVVSLLATLLSDWPAGSILLMNGRPEFFEVRGFEDGPDVSNSIRFVVLDGQQRLTALFHALRGRGDVTFVVKAAQLAASDGTAESIEEAIEIIPRAKWRREYDIARQSRERLVPLHELRTASDFFSWRDRAVDAAPEKERTEIAKTLIDVYRSHLGRLNTYSFPTVTLDNQLPPPAVARIFERINLTGLRLNTFDLLVARVYEPDWNLRDRWDTARRESEPIAHWLGDDGLPVIQVISLFLEGDIRQPALLELKARDIRNTWDGSLRATETAINKIREIGVPAPSWMPYRGLLFPLADRVMRLGPDSLSDDGELATWFWARSFGMDYGVGSSTRIALDSRLLANSEPDWNSAGFAIDRRVLLSATRRQQSALWAAFISFLAAGGARDLITGDPFENAAEDAVVVTLFPRASSEGSNHLRVLGLALASRASAKLLRSNRLEFFETADSVALSSQQLPSVPLLQSLSDPDGFFQARLALLEEGLNGLSGAPIRWFDGRESSE